MNLKCITKTNSNPKGKPKVYFTCHPHDVEYCIKKISDDIFKTHDCVICYTESMEEEISCQNMDLDMGIHNLFVIPITRLLLTTPNRAIDVDLPYALKEHIPVLPIMMEYIEQPRPSLRLFCVGLWKRIRLRIEDRWSSYLTISVT